MERDKELTPEVYNELREDMEEQLSHFPLLKRIKIIRNGEQKLGAEVGAIFVEFQDKKSASIAVESFKERVYDFRKLHVCFVDEAVYFTELYVE